MTEPCNDIIADVAYRWVPADAVASDIRDQVDNQVFLVVGAVVDHHVAEYLREELIYGDCFD